MHSLSLTHHAILSSTVDVAIGDLLDKSARCILPDALLRSSGEIMYGRLLERFAFPGGGDNASEHSYRPPRSRGEEVARRDTRWGWSLPVPLAEKRTMELSFSGLGSAVQRICGGGHVGGSSEGEGEGEEERRRWPPEERVELAREVMRVAFEHLAGRTVMALDQMSAADPRAERSPPITTLVVSGGVAANRYMQTM